MLIIVQWAKGGWGGNASLPSPYPLLSSCVCHHWSHEKRHGEIIKEMRDGHVSCPQHRKWQDSASSKSPQSHLNYKTTNVLAKTCFCLECDMSFGSYGIYLLPLTGPKAFLSPHLPSKYFLSSSNGKYASLPLKICPQIYLRSCNSRPPPRFQIACEHTKGR